MTATHYASESRAAAALAKRGYVFDGHSSDWPDWALGKAKLKGSSKKPRLARNGVELSYRLVSKIMTEAQTTFWRKPSTDDVRILAPNDEGTRWYTERL